MKKQNHSSIITLSLIGTLALSAYPTNIFAQYYGIGHKKRQEVIIDFEDLERRQREQELVEQQRLKQEEEDRQRDWEMGISQEGVPAEFREQCSSQLPKAYVQVNLINENRRILYNHKSILELSEQSRHKGISADTPYVFSRTYSKSQYSYRVDANVMSNDKYVCLTPKVTIDVVQPAQITEIAKEIVPGSCLESHVLAHEQNRGQLNTQIAENIQAKLNADIQERLNAIGVVYGDEMQTKEWIGSLIEKHVEPRVKAIEQTELKRHKALNDLENSNYFFNVCDKEGYDLIQALF